jgi:hypothetical protein
MAASTVLLAGLNQREPPPLLQGAQWKIGKGDWLKLNRAQDDVEPVVVNKSNDKKDPDTKLPTRAAVPKITLEGAADAAAQFVHMAILPTLLLNSSADPPGQPVAMGEEIKWLHSEENWTEDKSFLHSQPLTKKKMVFDLESSPQKEFDAEMHAARFKVTAIRNERLGDQLDSKALYVLLMCLTSEAAAPPLTDPGWFRLGLIKVNAKPRGRKSAPASNITQSAQSSYPRVFAAQSAMLDVQGNAEQPMQQRDNHGEGAAAEVAVSADDAEESAEVVSLPMNCIGK